jgi:hypothetical protein
VKPKIEIKAFKLIIYNKKVQNKSVKYSDTQRKRYSNETDADLYGNAVAQIISIKNPHRTLINDQQENPINKPTEIERRYNCILSTFKGLIPKLARQKENSYQN